MVGTLSTVCVHATTVGATAVGVTCADVESYVSVTVRGVGVLLCRATQSDYMYANKARRRVHAQRKTPCDNWCESERGPV